MKMTMHMHGWAAASDIICEEMEGQHMATALMLFIIRLYRDYTTGSSMDTETATANFPFGLAKLGSSASSYSEKQKDRALCEIFGNYGWAEGNSFMKWLTNHMLVRELMSSRHMLFP